MPTLGEQLDKLYINMSVALRLSQHQRMNLQHSLNVSLTRLHMNKPAGTHGLTPTLAYFDIVPARTIRTKSQKNVLIRICGRWKRSHHICVNSVLVLKHASAVRAME